MQINSRLCNSVAVSVALVGLCSLSAGTSVIAAGASETVIVKKEPLDLLHKYFETDMPQRPPFIPLRHREGTTQWLFKCKTESLEYDLLKIQERKDHLVDVTIRVTKVNILLRLPVSTWYSKRALPDTKEHEQGHVEIVRRVYVDADRVAQRSAQAVIGQSFTAAGRNKDEAIVEATKKANHKIYESYREQIADRAAEVTKIYDDLESFHDSKLTPAQSIEEAFKRYQSRHKAGGKAGG